jgi:RNA polymerase sigma-70 factor, ECF subfamily
VKFSFAVHNQAIDRPIRHTEVGHGEALNAPQLEVFTTPPFEVVFAEHSGFVWRLLVRLGVQARDAADVSQEVFLVVHRRLADFDPERSALRSWISGICLRAASEYRRRNPARHETSDERLENVPRVSGPDSELEARRAWTKLAQVLENMDSEKRQVFVLYELEALPMSEIAIILDCPAQTAYSRLHAARRLVLSAFQEVSEP